MNVSTKFTIAWTEQRAWIQQGHLYVCVTLAIRVTACKIVLLWMSVTNRMTIARILQRAVIQMVHLRARAMLAT
jgi:hypothetical protein